MLQKIIPGILVQYKYPRIGKIDDVGLVLQIVKGDQSPFPDGEEAAYILWPNHFKQHCMMQMIELYR